ncbi:unnamed protein product [Amoebophrya sp. A120]|nr:unnamed protein product [Amoebophrya sp. A120]|eukprot:GSA120T00005277001.1
MRRQLRQAFAVTLFGLLGASNDAVFGKTNRNAVGREEGEDPALDAIMAMSEGLRSFQSEHHGNQEAAAYLSETERNLDLLAGVLQKQHSEFQAAQEEERQHAEARMRTLEANKKRAEKEIQHKSRLLTATLNRERTSETKFATSERMRGSMAYRVEQLLGEVKLLRDRLKTLRITDYVKDNAKLRTELARSSAERDRLRATTQALVREETKLAKTAKAQAQCAKVEDKYQSLFVKHNRLQLEHDALLQQKHELEADLAAAEGNVEKQQSKFLDLFLERKGSSGGKMSSENVEHSGNKPQMMSTSTTSDKQGSSDERFATELQAYIALQPREVLEKLILEKLQQDFTLMNAGRKEHTKTTFQRFLHGAGNTKGFSDQDLQHVQEPDQKTNKLLHRKKQAFHNLLHRDFFAHSHLENHPATPATHKMMTTSDNDNDYILTGKWIR